jgi:hypothetical protein
MLDFNVIAQNFNQLAPIPTAGPALEAASLGALVPEPGGLGMLALTAGYLGRRRRGRA